MLLFIGKLSLSDEYPYTQISDFTPCFASFCMDQISNQNLRVYFAAVVCYKISYLLCVIR